MEKLELPVLEGKSQKDALAATIVARDADDKRVTIKLKARTEQTTKVSIRIGTFGDQTKAHMIYNRIRESLQAMTAEAQDATPEAPEAPAPSSPPPATEAPAPQAPVQAQPAAPDPPPAAPTASATPVVAPADSPQ